MRLAQLCGVANTERGDFEWDDCVDFLCQVTDTAYYFEFATTEGSERVAQAFEKAAERMEASDG